MLRSIAYFIACLASVVAIALVPHNAHAVTWNGPEDSRTRYALEFSDTTNETTLSVPVYYKTAPTGNISVTANSFKVGQSGIKVSFNGAASVSATKTFTIPKASFSYDSASGWYKATITAKMTGQGTTKYYKKFIHFRLELANKAGYIGYGGGAFQQVSKDYNPNVILTTPSTYKLYLATPCTVETATIKNLIFKDLDHNNKDNGYLSVTVKVYDETAGGDPIATRIGKDYPTSMGQNGTLSIPVSFKPLHKYRVELTSISPNNVIRYDFPYDNITYTVGCKWAVSATTTVNVAGTNGQTSAKPGEVIKWTHTLKNAGPHYTDQAIMSNINLDGSTLTPSGWSTGMTEYTTPKQAAVGTIRTIAASTANKTQYTPKEADVGKKICQKMRYTRTSSDDDSNGGSTAACVTIKAKEWSLTPSSKISKTESGGDTTALTVTPGETVYFKHFVKNNGTDTATYQRVLNTEYAGSAPSTSTSATETLAGGATYTRSPVISKTIPLDAPNGAKYCQSYGSTVTSSTNKSPITGNKVCATVTRVWTLTPTATVSSQVAPDQTLTWTHNVKNNGPQAMLGTLKYQAKNTSNLTDTLPAAWSSAALASGASAVAKTTTHKITQGDVGKTLCRATTVTPGSSTNTGTVTSTAACREIPYNYTLTPSVTLSIGSIVEVGGTFTVKPTVNNSGPTKSKPSNWQLSYIELKPGVAIPAGANNTTAPCTYYGSTRCQTMSTGSNKEFAKGITDLSSLAQTVKDLEVGTKICYALSVSNWTASNTDWKHSAPICVVVSKRPVTQIFGGDLIVGRNTSGKSVRTNTKVLSGKQYGSWAQYGIIASKEVVNMASASGLAGGVTPKDFCQLSNLTLGNAPTGGTCVSSTPIGGYTLGGTVPAVAAKFTVPSGSTPLSGSVAIASKPAKTVYSAASTLTLTASELSKGQWYVINAPAATITITGNLTYKNEPLSSIADIPQLVIIANKIIIKDTVTQVDAWLVASGTAGEVNTCGAGTEGGTVSETSKLTSNVCKNVLRVNGPVIAKKLYLRRTAGAGANTASGDPAEVFNLRPDAYLWATNLLNAETKVRTVLTNELPPRY